MGAPLLLRKPPRRSLPSVPKLDCAKGAEYRNAVAALVVSANKRRFGRGDPSIASSRLCFLLEVLDALCQDVPELADCRDRSESDGGMSCCPLPGLMRFGAGARVKCQPNPPQNG